MNCDILREIWHEKYISGEDKAREPELAIFNNCSKALKLLDKHINLDSRICLHTDVDVDGIGTTYILKRVLEKYGSLKHLLLINKDKVHGIQKKHADYFNNSNSIDFIIITDSSSNEIDTIRSFNCDVLCIDHHDFLKDTDSMSGKCNDGIHEYVIVNSTVDNLNQDEDEKWIGGGYSKYIGNSEMSCGLVVYELLRIYTMHRGQEKLLENMKLYQWAGITLFTDVIDTLNERNQYYLDKTVFDVDREGTIYKMAQRLNKFNRVTSKNFINYTLAPMINRAIRAGNGAEALDIVINRPDDILELEKYKEVQEKAINKALYRGDNKIIFDGDSVCYDVTDCNIGKNYNGVIASKISDGKCNAAVYTMVDGLCEGSFRGRYKKVPYRKYFEQYKEGIYAQGHDGAFGYRLGKEDLESIMNNIIKCEPSGRIVEDYISVGDIPIDDRGRYHFNTFEEFKKDGLLWKIAVGNAKVSKLDEITIKVKASDVVLQNIRGKLYLYNVSGLECKAFKTLEGKYFNIYAEYTTDLELVIN